MKTSFLTVILLSGTAAIGAAQQRTVAVTFADGRVTIILENATATEALKEWAKVGKAELIGAERLPSQRLTCVLRDVDEFEALRTIIGSSLGLAMSLKAEEAAGASQVERLIVLPSAREESPKAGVISPEPNVPEKQYEYFAPTFPLPEAETPGHQVEYLPNAKPDEIPERVYRYYGTRVVEETLQHKGNEPLKVPLLPVPEKRFEYYTPARALAPEKK